MSNIFKRRAAMLALTLVLWPSAPAWAQVGQGKGAGDERVRRALVELGMTYEALDTGAYRVTLPAAAGKRRQAVYFTATTETFDGLEVREVWSPALRFRGEVPQATANRLLRDKPKFGGWQAVFTDGSSLVYFVAHVNADADAGTLKAAADMVSEAADRMEQEITGGDAF